MRPCDVVFPNFTFSICSYDTPGPCLQFRTNPARLKREIFTLNPKHKKNWLGEYNEFPIFFRTLKPYSFSDSKVWKKIGPYVLRKHVEETIRQIMEKTSSRYAGIGIMQGWAVEAALILGADKITLAGCEGRITEDKRHAEKLEFFFRAGNRKIGFKPGQEFSKEQKILWEEWGRRARTEAQWLAEILRPYGVEVSRYFYKKGYEAIT